MKRKINLPAVTLIIPVIIAAAAIPVFPASIVLVNNTTIECRITGETSGTIQAAENKTNINKTINKNDIMYIKYPENEAGDRKKGRTSSAVFVSVRGNSVEGIIASENNEEIRLINVKTGQEQILKKAQKKSIEYYEKYFLSKDEISFLEKSKKLFSGQNSVILVEEGESIELRAGVEGGMTLPIGDAGKVIDPGYGGSLWISSNIIFMQDLPYIRNFKFRDFGLRSHLILEAGYYIASGQSVRNYEGTDIKAKFMPFSITYAYMIPLKIVGDKEIQFMPKLGFGGTQISATIGTASVQSNDFILLPGLVTAYNINRDFQVFLNIDNFMFFEQKIGMQIRAQLGVNYLIF